MLVELGGGATPHPDADVILDLRHPKNSPAQDLAATPWLLDSGVIPDSSVDVVYASNVLEHIPAGQPRLAVMAETHRILKPGGRFLIKVPLVGYNLDGPHAVVDYRTWSEPTHVSAWWFPEGLMFFTESGADFAYMDVPRFAPLGPFIPWAEALHRFGPHLTGEDGGSWWSVWDDWEGIASLVRP